jgi:periplasmic divalent cation tolerance protein
METLLVISTFPDAETAERIARELVTRKLAACANIGTAPVRSIYHWDGKIEEAQEVMVFFKTTNDRFNALREELRTMHPYEVPEIVAVNIADGLPEYLHWVAASCGAEPDSASSAT